VRRGFNADNGQTNALEMGSVSYEAPLSLKSDARYRCAANTSVGPSIVWERTSMGLSNKEKEIHPSLVYLAQLLKFVYNRRLLLSPINKRLSLSRLSY
jgi:hypothetical protein